MNVDIQVSIDDQHKLTFTTPDGKSSSKQYPLSWSEQDILEDFARNLPGITNIQEVKQA